MALATGESMRGLLLGMWLAGCLTPISETHQAVGDVKSGFPGPWERALLMAANRARSDPATVRGPDSAMYAPQAPLVLDHDLARAARFHATTLETGQAPLMHDSPCTLVNDVAALDCDGRPACACVGGATCQSCGSCAAGTHPFVRVGYFYRGLPSGEIAAAGYGDPFEVMDGWVDEPAGADGHRRIVDGDSGVVGFGHAEGASGACWGSFDVGDFGAERPAPARIASATANQVRIYATWNDPGGGSPRSLHAVVDGKCEAMSRELGDDHLNATWTAPLSSGCHSIYILGADSAGNRVTYPSGSAFTVGCSDDEVPQAPPDCDPVFAPAEPPSPSQPPSPSGSIEEQPITIEGGCSAVPSIPLDGAWILLVVAAVRRLTRRR